jgi:hypothetical protein
MSRWIPIVVAGVGLLSMPGCQCIHAFEQWKCNHLGCCVDGIEPTCPPPVTIPYGSEALPPPTFVPGEPTVAPGEAVYPKVYPSPRGSARPSVGTGLLKLPSNERPLRRRPRTVRECSHRANVR